MSVSPKNLTQGETREYKAKSSGSAARKPTAEEIAAEAIEAATPAPDGTTASAQIGTDREEVYIDPQELAQATQNKNARLIAMMVHENAMLEVALEQERRARQDAENKYGALLESLRDD